MTKLANEYMAISKSQSTTYKLILFTWRSAYSKVQSFLACKKDKIENKCSVKHKSSFVILYVVEIVCIH